MSSKAIFLALCASVLLSTGTTHAALFDRGSGLIYDDVLNVTWLQDANYAKTSGYDTVGWMTWLDALAWADSLVYHDTVRNVDWTDWRLPSTTDTGAIGRQCTFGGTDCGYNSVGSEMAYMYYQDLGLKGVYSSDGFFQSDWGLFGNGTKPARENNVAPFVHIQANAYWSGSEAFGPQSSRRAWTFEFDNGFQNSSSFGADEFFAWAVRDGDVASSSVPEPTTIALTLLALAGLGFGRLRPRPL